MKYRAVNILLPFSQSGPNQLSGDYYYGLSLARAFERHGLRVRITHGQPNGRFRRYVSFLRRVLSTREFDLILHGPPRHRSLPGSAAVIWAISKPDDLSARETQYCRHVFCASRAQADMLCEKGLSASFLPQCTDGAVFGSVRDQTEPAKYGVVFVGNRHFDRPIVQNALDLGFDLDLWGRGWDEIAPSSMVRGEHVANDQLGEIYRNASVVLNDHSADMFRWGCFSNRSYDVLASGTPVVTEEMAGIPDDLRSHLYLYRDKQTLGVAIKSALAETKEKRAERVAFAQHVRKTHSFDTRATEIMDFLTQKRV